MPNPTPLHELLAWLRDPNRVGNRDDTRRWADALAEVLLVQDAHQHVADLCAGVENDAFTEVVEPAQMTYAGGLVPINSDGMRKVIDDASRLAAELEAARAQALADRAFQTENVRLAAEVAKLRARHNPEVCVDTMELNERLWREREEARAEAAAARDIIDELAQMSEYAIVGNTITKAARKLRAARTASRQEDTK